MEPQNWNRLPKTVSQHDGTSLRFYRPQSGSNPIPRGSVSQPLDKISSKQSRVKPNYGGTSPRLRESRRVPRPQPSSVCYKSIPSRRQLSRPRPVVPADDGTCQTLLGNEGADLCRAEATADGSGENTVVIESKRSIPSFYKSIQNHGDVMERTIKSVRQFWLCTKQLWIAALWNVDVGLLRKWSVNSLTRNSHNQTDSLSVQGLDQDCMDEGIACMTEGETTEEGIDYKVEADNGVDMQYDCKGATMIEAFKERLPGDSETADIVLPEMDFFKEITSVKNEGAEIVLPKIVFLKEITSVENQIAEVALPEMDFFRETKSAENQIAEVVPHKNESENNFSIATGTEETSGTWTGVNSISVANTLNKFKDILELYPARQYWALYVLGTLLVSLLAFSLFNYTYCVFSDCPAETASVLGGDCQSGWSLCRMLAWLRNLYRRLRTKEELSSCYSLCATTRIFCPWTLWRDYYTES